MPRSHPCLFVLSATLLYLIPGPAHARPPVKPVSFINDIAPIFKESCFGCHGAKSPKGKLDMTKYASLRKGGTKDDPVVEGKPEDSYLADVLTATDKRRMPPLDSGDALPKDKVALIERWIKEGAKLDAGLKAEADLVRELRARWTPPVPPAAYPFPVTVTALAFTPDSKKVVAAGHHELNVFDAATGALEKRVRTRSRRAMAMAFLPDGKLVVAGGRPGEEGDVRVYDLNAKGKQEGGVTVLDGVKDKAVLVKQLGESDDEILALAVSADGKKLAAGGCDRIVTVWDLSGGLDKATPEAAIENHADWVFGVAFSDDAKKLYTSSRDKTAKVWDLVAKESLLTFPDHQNTVYGVLPSGGGKAGLSVGEDNQLRMWNTTGDKAGKSLRNAGHGKPVFRVAAVPGKPAVVTCSADMTVRSWNAETLAAGKSMGGFTDHVYAVAASPDGNLVAGGAFNGEVRVFKLADGALVKAFSASPGLKK
ncbi:MAG: c-type cytochrome domain-containing protein [Gemmataceae bacterium]